MKALPLTLIIIITLLFVTPHLATAQGPFADGIIKTINWGRNTGGLSRLGVNKIIINIIRFVYSIAGILSVLGIVIGGTMYIVSIGNEQKIAQAKKVIIFSMIGLFIVLTAYVFAQVVYQWLGLAPSGPNSPTAKIVIVIGNIITFLGFFLGIITSLFIIIGGFMYITSGGNEQKTAKAKQTIFAAAAGLLIAISAHYIGRIIWGFKTGDPTGATYLRVVISNIITVVLSFTAIISVAAFVYGGFTYITSGGNDDRLQKGKKVVIYTVVGIAIIMLSATIVNLIFNL